MPPAIPPSRTQRSCKLCIPPWQSTAKPQASPILPPPLLQPPFQCLQIPCCRTTPTNTAARPSGEGRAAARRTPSSSSHTDLGGPGAPEAEHLRHRGHPGHPDQPLERSLPGRLQDENRNQIISVSFGQNAFFCQVKSPSRPRSCRHSSPSRRRCASRQPTRSITLVSEMVDEKVREKGVLPQGHYQIPLTTIDPGPET